MLFFYNRSREVQSTLARHSKGGRENVFFAGYSQTPKAFFQDWIPQEWAVIDRAGYG